MPVSNELHCSCRSRGSERKLVLPPIIPWESGGKTKGHEPGDTPIGAIRGNTLNIKCSRRLSDSSDGAIPQLTCPPFYKELASQKGFTSFGSHRPQVTNVLEHEHEDKVSVNKLINDRSSESILKKWDQPNSNVPAGNIGKQRETRPVVLRELSDEEKRKCKASIPRFMDPSHTEAELHAKSFKERLHADRKNKHRSTMSSEELAVLDPVQRTRYMAWIGGQLTTVSSFPKPDTEKMKNMTYYERLIYERQFDPKVLKEKLETEAGAEKGTK